MFNNQEEIPMTIMAVDNHPFMRGMVTKMLAFPGVKFHECTTGKEALESYPTVRPDWIVMDINMEEMDGLRATQKIVAAYPEAKIVILTQLNDSHLRDAVLKAGATKYMLKDQLPELREFIHEQIESAASAPK